MSKITALDEQTNRKVTFEWDGQEAPNQEELQEVFNMAREQKPSLFKTLLGDQPQPEPPKSIGDVAQRTLEAGKKLIPTAERGGEKIREGIKELAPTKEGVGLSDVARTMLPLTALKDFITEPKKTVEQIATQPKRAISSAIRGGAELAPLTPSDVATIGGITLAGKGLKVIGKKALQKLGRPLATKLLGAANENQAIKTIVQSTKSARQAIKKVLPKVQPAEKLVDGIRLDKFSKQAQPVIKEATKFAGQELPPRKPISNNTLRNLADDLTNTMPDQTKRTEFISKIAKDPRAQKVLATRDILQGQAEGIQKQAATVLKSGDPIDRATFIRDFTNFSVDTLENYQKVKADVGRALQQFQMLAKSPMFKAAESISKGKVTDVENWGKFKWDSLIKQLGTLTPDEAGNYLAQAVQPRWTDKAYYIWINSILSGIRTHEVNMASNAVFTASKPVETALASGVDKVIGLGTGKRSIPFKAATAEATGAIDGFMGGVSKFVEVFKRGAEGVSFKPGQLAKFELKKSPIKGDIQKFLGKKVGKAAEDLIGAPTRFLLAADEGAKTIVGNMELYGQATKQAFRKVGNTSSRKFLDVRNELIKNPTREMVEKLIPEEQLYRSFQKAPGKITSAFINLRNTIPGGRWVVPFVNTISNLSKTAIERSPLGFARPIQRKLAGEKVTQAVVSEDLARALFGTTVATAAAMMWATGRITGAPPKEEGRKNVFFETGKQPDSVKIGDTWVQYGRIQPVGTVIGAVARMLDSARDRKEPISQKSIMEMGASIGNFMLDQSFLTGFSNLLEGVQEPSRIGKVTNRILAGFVPASGLLRDVTRLTDPVIRKPEGLVETVKAGIPGLSKSVPARLNVFGEEIKRTTGISDKLGTPTGALERSVTPITVSVANPDPVINELDRLSVGISSPPKTINRQKIALYLEIPQKDLPKEIPRDIWEKMAREIGPKLKEVLSKVVKSSSYQRLNNQRKTIVLKNVITKVKRGINSKFIAESKRRLFEKRKK